MKIAILAWGSLVWDPRTLQIEGDWINEGPELEIEFSRVSKDGRLTLVIDSKYGAKVRTYYGKSIRADIGDAIADLRDREGTIRKRIGYADIVNSNNSNSEFHEHEDVFDNIIDWCNDKKYDAAVWTALPSQFYDQTNLEFSVDNAINYLEKLPLSAKNNAINYIKKAPIEIITPVREKLEAIGYSV